ncbi:MAG: glutamate 5-kinase [bacterium]
MSRSPARRREPALRARRVVVKVGSSVLTAPDERGVNRRVLGRIAAQLVELRAQGREVILVSSGSIAAGSKRLDWKNVPRGMSERQAAAAVGQPILMDAYGRAFKRRGVEIAQILLTHADLDVRTRFLNARNTFEALLSRKVLPIVNENDSVSVEEIRFGDNDTLAAQVALMIQAELVVILSDVEGLYDADPRKVEGARLLHRVEGLPGKVVRGAGESANPYARGGMVTKMEAVRVLNRVGIATLIVRGREPGILLRVLAGEEEGTFFVPNGARLKGRKSWIGTTATPKGWIRVDKGAAAALLKRGKSLLPSGVVAVGGDFHYGDLVELRGPGDVSLGRGLASYSAEDAARIAGKHTREIASILGRKDYDEIIHRSNLVLND